MTVESLHQKTVRARKLRVDRLRDRKNAEALSDALSLTVQQTVESKNLMEYGILAALDKDYIKRSIVFKYWLKYKQKLLDYGKRHYGNYVVVDRIKQTVEYEMMPAYARIGLHLLFVGNLKSRVLETKTLDSLFARLTIKQGEYFDSPSSKTQIPHFIQAYDIKLDELLVPNLEEYHCFNEFFYRKLKPDARAIDPNPNSLVSCSDSRLVVYENVEAAKSFWIKGKRFGLSELFDNEKELMDEFKDGVVAIFRLAPQDYHRFHMPVEGTCAWSKRVTGTYWTVNPLAVKEDLNVLTENARTLHLIIDPSNSVRKMAMIPIGALLVGSVVWTGLAGNRLLKKGEEAGYFAYGGSTVVCVWPRDQVKIDSDLLSNSAKGLETLVRVGEKIGEFLQESYLSQEDQDFHLTGWLFNMHDTLDTTSAKEHASFEESGVSAVEYYFLKSNTQGFRLSFSYSPYFYLMVQEGQEEIVKDWLERKWIIISSVQVLEKQDLNLVNHLTGLVRKVLRLEFKNCGQLWQVRKELLSIIQRNKRLGSGSKDQDQDLCLGIMLNAKEDMIFKKEDPSQSLLELREFDIPYYLRTAIDNDLFVGVWYDVIKKKGKISIKARPDLVKRPEPVVLAFDLETSKAPLKFPDSSQDQIMMISYMIDGNGYLITNQSIVSQPIEDFEFTPKPELEGKFRISNQPNELELLKRFFQHTRESQPSIFVTYNGDSFDWPFVEARAKYYGLTLSEELVGFSKNSQGEYCSKQAIHMDCFRWVKRDSYLPMGSQGLKAVAHAKLGYDPVELDPEEMTPLAYENPQKLAEYSVSDAVATYYLYMKYVHPFIFSLCTIIPLNPDDVLRKGSGTLCEVLLMVQAYRANVIMPNKHAENPGKTYKGHLLESETYIGGHVEALEAGVFRNDLPVQFNLNAAGIQQLIDELDDALKFTLEKEELVKLDQVSNYDEVYNQIKDKLVKLKETPVRRECPLIYHLDVAAMYPNIILTNRLQPDAIVTEQDCALCDFNLPGKLCDRRMTWSWRGQFYTAKKSELKLITTQLEQETFPALPPNAETGYKGVEGRRSWNKLDKQEQQGLIQKRLAEYCRKVYGKTLETQVVEKESIVCQREHPFYIDTVKSFRDRRYEYKALQKQWKQRSERATEGKDQEEAKKMIILYDSLQLAHKCILNSFYGYVMRKGARWYSMEMAGIVCLTGAAIIQMARTRIDQLGRPLELDTDGIWCVLPQSFPEVFSFTLEGGKKIKISYPCSMLNHLVYARFTNNQYHHVTGSSVDIKEENSIFFEVDGPYRAMILPSSKEEDKLIKKRYAVFNQNGSLAELKGFEVKRRGEVKLIKIFQGQIFGEFLKGDTLTACYAAVAKVANIWLDVLHSQGVGMSETEIVELLCENRSMSRALEDYGGQKSTSTTTARRLAEFLGEKMVQEKGLACKFIISAWPQGLPISQRAIPVAIFSAEESVKSYFLRKWLKDSSREDLSIRGILDWSYYLDRLGSVIQKLITIPAAMQQVENPIPRVKHPAWLIGSTGSGRQTLLTSVFTSHPRAISDPSAVASSDQDIEDFARPAPLVTSIITPATKETPAKNNIVKRNPHDPWKDYTAWLMVQKELWRIKRESAGLKSKDIKGIGGLVKKNLAQLSREDWQILQISPPLSLQNLNRMNVWLYHQDIVKTIQVEVPRLIYINTRVPFTLSEAEIEDGIELKQVSHVRLPRRQTCLFLYLVTMKEESFDAWLMKLNQDPRVLGVYETQLSLTQRAVLQMGAVCRVRRSSGAKFTLSDLQLSPNGARSYLSKQLPPFSYLYHYASADLVAIYEMNEAKLYIFCQTTYSLNPSHLRRFYAETYSEASGYSTQLEVVIHASASVKDVYSATEAWLSNKANNRKTIMFWQSSWSMSRLVEKLPSFSKFPTLALPLHSKDRLSVQGVDWARLLAQQLINNIFTLNQVLKERVALAQFCNIPLCQLEGDVTVFACDILFGRRLQQQGLVLWWNSSPFPDLGLLGDGVFFTLEQQQRQLSSVLNNPGLYAQQCFSVEISGLVINTILSTMEDSDLMGDSKSIAVVGSLAEDERSLIAFSALKALIKSWWSLMDEEPSAGLLLTHFYRWFCLPTSNLYDPVLVQYLQTLVDRMFLRLVGTFRRLGAFITYASPTRMVIKTTKFNRPNAVAFGNWLLGALGEEEYFKFLDVKIIENWDYLLWLDRYNYASVNIKADLAELELEFHFKRYLPVQVQPNFDEIVGEFLQNCYLSSLNAGTDKEGQVKELEVYVRTKLTQKLLTIIQNNRHLAFVSNIQDDCYKEHPLLYFVVALCKIVGLHGRLEGAARGLMRDALALLKVSPFSKSAEFVCLPVHSIILRDWFCQYCQYCADLDLSRFPDQNSCTMCGCEFDPMELEYRLLAWLQRFLNDYYLQDLTCIRCNQIKQDHLRNTCKCAAGVEFVPTLMTAEKRDMLLSLFQSHLSPNSKIIEIISCLSL